MIVERAGSTFADLLLAPRRRLYCRRPVNLPNPPRYAVVERGNQRGGVESRPGGESDIRSVAPLFRREPDS
jgi:hypothetical protein